MNEIGRRSLETFFLFKNSLATTIQNHGLNWFKKVEFVLLKIPINFYAARKKKICLNHYKGATVDWQILNLLGSLQTAKQQEITNSHGWTAI